MRCFAFAVLVLVAIGGAHPVRAADPSDASAIRTVIQDQLRAFMADDGKRAFLHASPGIRRLFGTPENFMAMVRRGYPQVYRPQSVEFVDVVNRGDRIVQRVRIVGSDGSTVMAHYPMEQQPDGTWRIDGCYLERLPEMAV